MSEDKPRMRCDTCRWWNRLLAEDGGYGQCRAILPDLGCDTDDVAFMAVPDCSQYPHFTTRADFGCVLWEPHDTEGDA